MAPSRSGRILLPNSSRQRAVCAAARIVIFADIPRPERRQIFRNLHDRFTQLERRKKGCRVCAFAPEGAEDVAGDRSGRIRIAVMIHGPYDTIGKIPCRERAIDRNGERLFSNPALPQGGNGFE